MMNKISILALLIGFILDLIFGDPHQLPHPVRFIGTLISKLEKKLRKVDDTDPKKNLLHGCIFVFLVLFVSTIIPFLIIKIAGYLNPYVRLVIESIMCYQLLATKSLKDESMKVYKELKKKDVEGARKAVSMIVGRDTKHLTEEGIAKAAVETVAENTSDGIIAPMLFMALGGAVFGFFYKAVNTMDSMVGYKNDKYLYFGRPAAKLDDLLNFLPSRISALLMILASVILRLDAANAVRIFSRDRFNHASPNSAQTESVCAGALRVQLAGNAYYFGTLHKKKTIGDSYRNVSYQDIKTANQLLYVTALLCYFLVMVCSLLFIL